MPTNFLFSKEIWYDSDTIDFDLKEKVKKLRGSYEVDQVYVLILILF